MDEQDGLRDPSTFSDVTRRRLPTWLLWSFAADALVLVLVYVFLVR